MPSATRGDLFVLKTPFSAKKIQKHEILPCKKLLFSLSVQNEEIPYKNSGFGNFFVRNSLFLEFLSKLPPYSVVPIKKLLLDMIKMQIMNIK